MIRMLIHPDTDGDFTLIMPLNRGEVVGGMETVIGYDESTISQPYQDDIIAQLDVPQGRRGPGFRDQAWRGLTPPGVVEAARARFKQRRGQNPPPQPVVYFYDADLDIAIEQDNPITFPDSRMFKTIGVGDEEHQVPADPIDDGRYQGPYTATEALALVGGP